MRMIDADALKALYKEYLNEPHAQVMTAAGQGMQIAIKSCIEFLESATTIEAVPVVRCKDCKWYAPNNDDSWIGCALDTRHPEDEPKADDFCSYGERKDNGC